MSDPEPGARNHEEQALPIEGPPVASPSRGRSVAAVICLVLAALLTTPAAVAYWGQRTLNDATRYVDTVGPLVDSPEVQDVIATKVTTAIQQQVDVESILNQVFSGVITDRPRLRTAGGSVDGSHQRPGGARGPRVHRVARVRGPVGPDQHPGPTSAPAGPDR